VSGSLTKHKPFGAADSFQILDRLNRPARNQGVSVQILRTDELRVVISQKKFRVRALAAHVGLDVRTLERRFGEQLHTTPKTWIIRERMSFAPPLLAKGLSNKQVAASLNYTCESNFCRDFKRYFGCAPQGYARVSKVSPARVAF
jgi:AraC-like DNA-binding protein